MCPVHAKLWFFVQCSLAYAGLFMTCSFVATWYIFTWVRYPQHNYGFLAQFVLKLLNPSLCSGAFLSTDLSPITKDICPEWFGVHSKSFSGNMLEHVISPMCSFCSFCCFGQTHSQSCRSNSMGWKRAIIPFLPLSLISYLSIQFHSHWFCLQ